MSTNKTTFLIAAATLFWFGVSTDKFANAQVSIRLGTPSYYGNQPVYRSNSFGQTRVYSQPTYRTVQPTYRYSTPYGRTYSRIPQRYSSGYRGLNSQPVYGNSYQSFRPSYSSQPYYGQTYSGQSFNNRLNNGFGRGFNTYSPSQQRGAIVGGAIGNAVGGNRGANIGAAIGAAVRSQ